MLDFFAKMQLDLFIRPVLQQHLETNIKQQNWTAAATYLQAFVDSWPIAASIAPAYQHWTEHCDPMALAILHRANEIIVLLDTPAKDIPLPRPLPPYIELAGAELAARRQEVCSKASKNEITAVVFSSPVPDDPASQLALGELRMEALAQKAVERYGVAALLAPNAPPWERALGRAPAGQMGPKLRPLCDIAILPGTPHRLRQGQLQPTGWLLWNGPARPLPIADVGLTLIRTINQGMEAACQAAKIDQPRGTEILQELIQLGAIGHVE